MKIGISFRKLLSTCVPLAVAGLLLSTQPAAAFLKKGDKAPAIKLVTTAGQPVTLATFHGSVLIMDFFATWCAPCRRSIPHITSLYQKYGKQGLQVLGVSVDEGDDREVKRFIAERKMPYPVAIAGEDLQVEYGLRSIPTIYVIDKKGIVVEKYQGFSDQTAKAMDDTVKRLLTE